MIKIKCVFPKNYYLLRKVNIKINNKTIARIGHNEFIELEVPENEEIKFKLDYHKTTIKVSDLKTQKYLILYFNFRNYFPFSTTDIMFKNSLRAKFVDESEFNNFSKSFYKEPPFEPMSFNNKAIYTIIIGIFISCQFLIVPILSKQNSDDVNNFSFFIGIASLIGFISMIFNKKNITNKQYYIRMLAFGMASILLLIYMRYDPIFKIISFITALSIVLISTNKLMKAPVRQCL